MSTKIHSNPIFYIADNEFFRLRKQPLALIIALLVFIVSLVQGLGNTVKLAYFSNFNDVFIQVGMCDSFWYTTLFCSFLALCVGVISISEERREGKLNVLLTKPLYRRDIIAGKFFGASMFLILAVMVTIIVCVATSLIFYIGPVSYPDLIIRMATYGLILFFYCDLTLGIAMLFGVLFRDLSLALVFSFCYLCYCLRLGDFFYYLGSLKIINPYILYFYAVGTNIIIFNTDYSYMAWFDSVKLYLFLLILEIALVFLINCFIFNREES